MEKSKFRIILPAFLMVFLFSFTNSSYAQESITLEDKTNASQLISEISQIDYVSEQQAKTVLMAEMVNLKNAFHQTLTPGSTEAITAERKIETIGMTVKSINDGKTTAEAFQVGLQFLGKMDMKSQAQTTQIQTEILQLISN